MRCWMGFGVALAPTASEPAAGAGVRIEPETFARALRLYHQMEGWDPETGWPTFAKLAELFDLAYHFKQVDTIFARVFGS